MIPIEKLKQVTTIYTHASCPDGLASAMILKDAFRMLGMSPRIEFLAHNTKEHAQAGLGDDVVSLFCDFCPTPDMAQLMRGTGRMFVLDHHKGAEELVRSFGEDGVFADEKLEPGVSGAVLAFREVWMAAQEHREDARQDCGTAPIIIESVRDFALSVGARDTWQTQDPRFMRGQWISKMLMSKPTSYWLRDLQLTQEERDAYLDGGIGALPARALEPTHPPYLDEKEIEMGRALFEAHEEAVRQAVEQCVHTFVDGYGLFVFQEQACGFRLCSDVAEAIRYDQKKPLAPKRGRVVAGFSYVVDKPGSPPRLVYSLRGLNDFDVAAFAKANGGGGHTAAAGFAVDPHRELIGRTPYDDIQSRLAAFLEGRGRE